MKEFERNIDGLRARVRAQQEVIKQRRKESQDLYKEAELVGVIAHNESIRGVSDRAQGNKGYKIKLEEAERKQRIALQKEREADDLKSLAADGERNIHRLCDQMLENGRKRADVEREKEKEELVVAQLANDLQRYKREKEVCRLY